MSKRIIYFFLSFLLLLLIWQLIVTVGQFNASLFPGPVIVLQALFTLIKDGTLFVHLKDSLARFFIGYVLAAIVAISSGLLLGRSKWLWKLTDPIVQLLRPISPVAWSPFVVLVFGIGSAPAIVIIFIAAFFPILLTTVNGVQNVEKSYIHLANNLQLTTFDLYRKIIFPAALPAMMNGLHLALGTAWIFLVAGEMVGAQSGLGYLIVDARNMLHLPNVLAGIVAIGVCGFLLDRLVTAVQLGIRKVSGYQLF